MKLVSKGSDAEVTAKFVNKICEFVDYGMIQDAGLLSSNFIAGRHPRPINSPITKEDMAEILRVLNQHQTRCEIDGFLFKTLKLARDTILPKDSRLTFSSDALWASVVCPYDVSWGKGDMIAPSQPSTVLIAELMSQVEMEIRHIPIITICKNLILVQKMLYSSPLMSTEEGGKYHQDLGDIIFFLENLMEDLKSTDMFSLHLSLHLLSKMKAKDSSDTKGMSEEGVPSSCNSKVILAGIIKDVIDWINAVTFYIRTLPRPPNLPGVLTMSNDTINKIRKLADSSIRLNTIKGGLSPQDFLDIPEGDQRTDISILSECVQRCSGTESLYDWFDEFVRLHTPWDFEKKRQSDTNNSGGGGAGGSRKRKADDGESKDENDAEGKNRRSAAQKNTPPPIQYLKCRFAAALDLLEKTGVIAIKKNCTVEKQMYAWTSF